MTKVSVIILVVLIAVVLGFVLWQRTARAPRETSVQEIPDDPALIERILREMPNAEAVSTGTEATERRLRLATAIAQTGDEIDVTNCEVNPLVLEIQRSKEMRFVNRSPNGLKILIGTDYYTVPAGGTLTLKASFEVINNDPLIRYVCRDEAVNLAIRGFILLKL